MKRTGDLTLNFENDRGYKILSIEWKKIKNGTQGNKQFYTFDIRTKSAHGDCYNKHFHASSFELVDNETGKINVYSANK